MIKHLAMSVCMVALLAYSAYGQGCDAGCDSGCDSCCSSSVTDCCGTCGTSCGGCPSCGLFSGCGGCGLVGGCGGGLFGGGGLGAGGLGAGLFGDACGGGGCGCCPTKYVQLYGGYFRSQEVDTDFTFDIPQLAAGTGSIDLHTNNGYAVGGSVGRYLSCRLRGEVDFTYRNATFDRLEFALDGAPPTEVPLDGKINMYSFMANLFFDINRGGGVSPYVGGGAGFVFNRADIIEPTIPVSLDLDWSSFAYQLIAGVAVKVTHRASLFAEYRYFGTDKFQLGLGTPVGNFGAETDITNHNGFVGLRVDLP